MIKDLPKIYDPKEVEGKIYEKWEKSGFFNPDNLSGEPYSIMMPPPNVTGVLHLGHAMENTLMDIMARYQRMNGMKVLLLPGTDHAAVATQAKVEKILIEEGIKNPREELGRDKLLEKIREYAENSKSTILSQIKKMGTSCDWSRLAYTFDEKRNKAVSTVFKKMYGDGLIYQGYRTINWSVKGQSTCSDDELEHIERPAKLYTFKYSKDFPISIATTRPETKLGDTAVAVNLKDKRYKELIGQTFEIKNFAESGIDLNIKIIADDSVDSKFGTGAVGVTPAHSMVDFEIYEKQKSQRSSIKLIQVIGEDGKMNISAGNYAGLLAEKAREKIVQNLKKNNLLEKEEEVQQNVSTSDRFGDITEVIPMTQWFVDVNKKIPGKEKSLKELMTEAVSRGHNEDKNQKINITPVRFEAAYFQWIDNLRDWCISRQVWWGHRIPVWYKIKNNQSGGRPLMTGKLYKTEQEIYIGDIEPGKDGWKQDPDTLDTWFSSGLWTFSTLLNKDFKKYTTFEEWVKNSPDLKEFHPTSWIQMGYEILFFWMARMILMSTYMLDEIPFRNVYIHGMLRDKNGNKFSKSKGNNLDPIHIIEKYGTDALRFSLITGITPGEDSRFYEEKVKSARNFVNKFWNISRYIANRIGTQDVSDEIDKGLLVSDFWILEKMKILITEISSDIEKNRLSQASEKLYDFTWNDFADWYLEISKFEENSDVKNSILMMILSDLLQLWHPFIPYVTENIWKEIGSGDMLIAEKWPSEDKYMKITGGTGGTNLTNFELVMEIIKSIRNARLENKIDSKKKISVIIDIKNQKEYAGSYTKKLLIETETLIKNLRTGVKRIEILETGKKAANAIHRTVAGISIYIPTEGLINPEKEQAKAQKEIDNLEKYISGLEGRLNNKSFVDKAPEEVVSQQKESLAKTKLKIKEIKKHIKDIY